TVVEDKLLYLSSSVYGRVIPVPLFYFERGGRTYMLSPKLHYAAAQLIGDEAKALLIHTRDPVYPFTAISIILYDLGFRKQNKDYIEKYVCPEIRDIADGHIPLADKIRRVLNRYLAVKPAAGAVETLRCLCGLCDDARDLAVEVESLKAEIKAISLRVERADLGSLFDLLDDVERGLVMRVIRGFTIPGFKGELEWLLKKYGI
ncbi:MAG: hypothetical protein JZD41_00370, partial [Thermoproteus sp.]|nr:hypothetical protein [Thermoproteus sp.]